MIKQIADIEIYPNAFVYVGQNLEDEERSEFSLHSSDSYDKVKFIQEHFKNLAMIGFNNRNYDGPVMDYFMKISYKTNSVVYLLDELYKYSKSIINSDDRGFIKNKIPMFDLMKLHHYDNKARSCSLKWIAFAIRSPHMEDLPYGPDTHITKKELKKVISYCHNDVDVTVSLYKNSIKEIELRKDLSKKTGLYLYDVSDSSMGNQILLDKTAKYLGIDKYELKQLRTKRDVIIVKNLILPYITFQSEEFKSLLNKFVSLEVKETKGAFEENINFKGVTFTYALGGIHASKQGKFISDEEYILYDLDVVSFYPKLGIVNKRYPQHLSEKFCDVYSELFDERKLYPKGSAENYAIKIALNAAYGKSNEQTSWLYDPAYTMFITINGQLLLTMLIEKISSIAEIIQANTDGITVRLKRKDIDILKDICKDWENMTGLELESVVYKSMFIRDVNNYIAVNDKDKIKLKGDFEINKFYHKDHSMRVVPIAVLRACVNNISIEETITNHINHNEYTDIKIDDIYCKNYGIYDFCKAVRAKSGTTFRYQKVINGDLMNLPLSKTVRYYMSNIGGKIIKTMPPNTEKLSVLDKERIKNPNQVDIFSFLDDVKIDVDRNSMVEANGKITIFNDYFKSKDYNLDYNYYIEESYKLYNQICKF